jgi:transmembrane sensor
VTKEELKNIIKNHYGEKNSAEFARWVSSDNFEDDLDRFITEDLENELTKMHQIEDPALKTMAAKILNKASQRKNNLSEYSRPIPALEGNWQRRSGLSAGYKIAAALLLLAAFSFVVFFFMNNQTAEIAEVQIITKENLRGRKSTIFLKDGSIVYLNAESRIHFPEVFRDSLREVQLEGEAYFEISKDEAKPFVVSIGELKIRVLGTSFNANAYNDNEYIKVSLNTGKVRIESNDNNENADNSKVELNAGQCVSYSTKHNSFTKVSVFNPLLDLGWKDGTIVFENTSMQTMLQRLERWYNVDFEIKNSPSFRWNYTGEFTNQTLQDVLESLSFSQKFEYKINQDKVEIMFNPN